MRLARQLWEENLALAHTCRDHPFIRGIADGSLAPERFAYYVSQDACFLEANARAYSLAAASAPDWEGFKAFHQLVDATIKERQLHESYAATWGIDLSGGTPGYATQRYIDFLLAMAQEHDAGLAATAMAPCVRLYAFLGQTLAMEQQSEHRYSHWIKAYSSDEIEALAQMLEDLVDQYVKMPEQARAVYRYAMVCERDFFQAAWGE